MYITTNSLFIEQNLQIQVLQNSILQTIIQKDILTPCKLVCGPWCYNHMQVKLFLIKSNKKHV